MRSAGIIGVGHYLPDKVVTNDDIVAMGIDTSDEWIFERTGIRSRHVAADDQATSDLAYEAGVRAMQDADITADDLDLIIVSTTTPDYPLFPSTAALLQDRLGARTIGAFDVSAACSGFSYALVTACQYVQTGAYRHVLVVSADTLSKYVDWNDRAICILFGDGAGAAVVSEVSSGYGLQAFDLHANGGEGEILIVKGGGSRTPISPEVVADKSNLIHMNGRSVMKVAVNSAVPSVASLVEREGLSASDISLFVPHQANVRIIKVMQDRLGLSDDQVMLNIDRYGNTSGASIPIALSEAKASGRLASGDMVLATGFGAGFTWGSALMKWV